MSRKERERLTIMVGVKREELTQGQAAEMLGVCYRQTKRIWRRYQDEADAGLVHRLKGQPSARRKPAARHADPLYADCGPTLLSEHLAREGLVVDHNTLRGWLIAEGKWEVGRRRIIIVRMLRDGRVQLVHRGTKLKWRGLSGCPERVKPKRSVVRVQELKPPAVERPWRPFGMGAGREYWRGG